MEKNLEYVIGTILATGLSVGLLSGFAYNAIKNYYHNKEEKKIEIYPVKKIYYVASPDKKT